MTHRITGWLLKRHPLAPNGPLVAAGPPIAPLLPAAAPVAVLLLSALLLAAVLKASI
jgi:hypothetical protein